MYLINYYVVPSCCKRIFSMKKKCQKPWENTIHTYSQHPDKPCFGIELAF